MNIWHDLQHYAPGARSFSDQSMPMRQSRPVEVDGVFLGVTVEHELGVRFIAVDIRVSEMDQSIRPNLDYAYRSARQMFKSSRVFNPSEVVRACSPAGQPSRRGAQACGRSDSTVGSGVGP